MGFKGVKTPLRDSLSYAYAMTKSSLAIERNLCILAERNLIEAFRNLKKFRLKKKLRKVKNF